MTNALYICYFGLRQPLVQTQVLPYLRELKKDGHGITLLTFEPDLRSEWTAEQEAEMRAKLSAEGIDWERLEYHKRPSAVATAYDIFCGAMRVRSIIGKKNIDILHGRVHVPTLMGALGRRFSQRKPKLLFDIRGFFPEEYTEAGIWPENGLIYRVVKRIERWLMKESDAFVVLTQKARAILFPEALDSGTDQHGRPVEVIPCCVDLKGRFAIDRDELRAEYRDKLGIGERYVIVHAGALGGLYLTEQIADLLKAAHDRDERTFALFLTQSDPQLIVPLLKERGFGEKDHFVANVPPSEMPGYLCASDVGLSFVKAGYATQSRSPTKIPEYLACGIPIIANHGVGDIDDLVAENGIGVIVDGSSEADYVAAVEEVRQVAFVPDDYVRIAQEKFDLHLVGGRRYRNLYKRLILGRKI